MTTIYSIPLTHSVVAVRSWCDLRAASFLRTMEEKRKSTTARVGSARAPDVFAPPIVPCFVSLNHFRQRQHKYKYRRESSTRLAGTPAVGQSHCPSAPESTVPLCYHPSLLPSSRYRAAMTANGSACTRIIELTAIISENTQKIDQYFAANNLPSLSFDSDAPLDFPVPSSNKEIQHARRAVVNATQELHDLMVGPREHIRWSSWSVSSTSDCLVSPPCCATIPCCLRHEG